MNTNEPTTKRERYAPEVLMDLIKDRLPQIAEHFIRDRDWVWYCGPSLQKDEQTRAVLKELCFRWADKGHPIPDTDYVGSWGCSCLRPTKRNFRGGGKRRPDDSDPLSDLAALGL